MTLRSQTIRLGMFISTLIIAAILIFQLVWLRKVYNYEQKEFDHSIARAVRSFYDDLDMAINPAAHLSDLITRKNSQTYFVKVNLTAPRDSITYYLHNELEEEDVFTDCYTGLWDPHKNSYAFTAYLPAAAAQKHAAFSLPLSTEKFAHLTLYFPHRRAYILSLMNFWLITSALLLVVLILFSGSLYYFYRQKFLNETQKDFINNFTHEFKTPVSVISLAAETLQNPDIIKRPERLAKYAAIVKYQGQYLQNQIERLLHYAYAESNHLQLYKETVSVHALIKEAISNLQPLITERNATVVKELEASRDELHLDRGYLLIVITNLLENALKYAAQPKVIITTANEHDAFVLSVKDNGKGIEKKYLKKIFTKFYRITTGEQTAGRGFGLGLAFVKRIVDAHHGKITVESIPGIGSNFIIKLPLT